MAILVTFFAGCGNRRFVGSGVEDCAFGFGGLHDGFNWPVKLCSKAPKRFMESSCLVWVGVGRFILFFLLIPFLFFIDTFSSFMTSLRFMPLFFIFLF